MSTLDRLRDATPGSLPAPSPASRHWRLDERIVYLNHGSFGACPVPVQRAQQAHRDRMEEEAVSFFCDELFTRLDRTRDAIAGLIGGRPQDYVFLPNATSAVATIMDNCAKGIGLADPRPLGPGDEILVNDHEYPACLNIVERTAEATGATVVKVALPTIPAPGEPKVSADLICEMLLGAVTERTRLCMLSHITSPSGIIMPVDRLVPDLRERGVETLLDGAHGPGAIEFDIEALGAAFYTANCHKWLCAPKGAALLWVRDDVAPRFRPMVFSNYACAPCGTKRRSHFNLEFDYLGTDDYTARLAVADAIDIVPTLGEGVIDEPTWPAVMKHNRDLVMRGRDIVCDMLGVEPPVEDDLIGPLAMVPLPRVGDDRWELLRNRPSIYADALQDRLVERYRVQVPVWLPCAQMGGGMTDGRRFVRLSAQLYNSEAQYELLGRALVEEIKHERGG